MVTLLLITLIAGVALQLVASGSRLLVLGLLVYAFPLHFLVIALIAVGVVYYIDTH